MPIFADFQKEQLQKKLQNEMGSKSKRRRVWTEVQQDEVKDTIETQPRQEKLEAEEKRHNSDTIETQSRHTAIPPEKNPKDNADTIETQKRHVKDTTRDTLLTQPRHTTDTLKTHKKHNADTIKTPQETQSRNNTDTTRDTNLDKDSIERGLYGMRGQKLKLFESICVICIEKGSNEITRITYEALGKMATIPLGSVKTTLKRLRNEGLLSIKSETKGRGAFIDIEISNLAKDLFTKCIYISNRDTMLIQSGHHNRHSTDTTMDTKAPYSNSLYIYNDRTNTMGPPAVPQNGAGTDAELEGRWAEIIIPKTLKELHFGPGLIRQIKEGSFLTPEELQTSLNAFAFDIDENKILEKRNIPPVRYFMGIVRKKIPYLPPANFKSEEESAFEEMVRRATEKTQKRKEHLNRLAEAKFSDWFESLTEADRKNPDIFNPMFNKSEDLNLAFVRSYFDEKIWPQILKDLGTGSVN